MRLLLVSTTVLTAQLLAVGGKPTDEPLRGNYTTIDSAPLRCHLHVTERARYVLKCKGRQTGEGVLEHVGDGLALDTGRSSARLDELRAYEAAASMYMRRHLDEQGFYPLLAAPPAVDDSQTGTPCMMVPVSRDQHLFLVDFFDRDDFCTVAAGAGKPPGSNSHHLTFRSQTRRAGGVPWEEFCGADWKLRLR